MSDSANVRSLDAIEIVKSSLVSFRDQIMQSLTTIDIEMRRVLDWLEHDRPKYWKTQVRLARDGVTTAKADLHRCLMYPVGDERPSCREERAELKRAEAHLAYCEAKAERLQHWIREVRHEMFEYEGRIGQVKDIVESDVPQAIGILSRLLTRLQEYQALRQVGNTSLPPSSDGLVTLVTSHQLADELWPEKLPPSSELVKDFEITQAPDGESP